MEKPMNQDVEMKQLVTVVFVGWMVLALIMWALSFISPILSILLFVAYIWKWVMNVLNAGFKPAVIRPQPLEEMTEQELFLRYGPK